jgi:alpha-D-ribose 1-methylphosphonate 5-triphosphate synthase subunit PhnH
MESQRAFRAVLEAMSRPGRIVPAGETLHPPDGLHSAFGAVCLTLLDFETPVWTDLDSTSAAAQWLRFHCGSPPAAAEEASFVLITRPQGLCPIHRFHPGEEERPERAATVLVQTQGMGTRGGRILTGPGIPFEERLHVEGLPPAFWEERGRMTGRFPLGPDFIFTAGGLLAALPRSVRIEA